MNVKESIEFIKTIEKDIKERENEIRGHKNRIEVLKERKEGIKSDLKHFQSLSDEEINELIKES